MSSRSGAGNGVSVVGRMKTLGAALISILLLVAGPAAGEVQEDDINLSSAAPPI
jgi:hypothetical protein